MTTSTPPLGDANQIDAVARGGLPTGLPRTSYELLSQAADERPEARALAWFLETRTHERPFTWTFSQYFAAVTRAANLFHGLGVRPGDVVAVVLPNLPETLFSLWGAEAAGVALPINPLLEPAGIADLLRASKARVVVTLAAFPGTDLHARVVAAIAEAPDVAHLVTVDLAPYVRGIRGLAARLARRASSRAGARPRAGVQSHDFARAGARVRADGLEGGRVIDPDETASLFGTGGTTGSPKLARRTHAAQTANAYMSARMLGSALSDGVVFAGLPLFHVNGAMVTGLIPILTRSTVLMATPQGFRGDGVLPRFWEIVEHHRVTTFSGVPTVFSALLQHPPGGRDLSSLKYAICGAAPLAPELISQFERAVGVDILEGYGLTEATCVVAMNPLTGERKPGSVGLPIPLQNVRIARVDSEGRWRRDADVGETGVVALRGPNIFQGYVSEAHDRQAWLTAPDGERWLDTGDLGALDAEGYLWLRGRAKDLIIRGGHNIDPAMIEDAFFAHPSVALAAAIGRPDAHAGEVPVVYVQLKPGQTADAADLLAFAASRITERAARPKAVRILPELPLTAVGKVFKPRLRELEAAMSKTIEPAAEDQTAP